MSMVRRGDMAVAQIGGSAGAGTIQDPMSNTTRVGDLTSILARELVNLEGIQSQHPETGAGIQSAIHGVNSPTYIDQYTNRIFGAPFQLIDSVDRRFEGVNTHVGNEYLRNFILNSPILHIKPGMPKYTGATDSKGLLGSIKSIYLDTASGNMSFVESLLTELAEDTVFSTGSKLQKRMFGFRETYYNYMTHVNYMCRSMAVFLNLTTTSTYPNGAYVNVGGQMKLQPFETMKWENYRMLTKSTVSSPWQQLNSMAHATVLGVAGDAIGGFINEILDRDTASIAMGCIKGPEDSLETLLGTTGNSASTDTANGDMSWWDTVTDSIKTAAGTTVVDVMSDKICSVLFMVEPAQFEENLRNDVGDSAIESTLDSISTGIGQELAFITGSNVDIGMVEGITNFLGDSVTTATNFLSGITENVAGGFTANLFHGAIRSIKGQKMIYPMIYKKSESTMDYTFTVNLTSPYGDVYNYYMNIVVPLMHLIGLAAPRMVTANSTTSPFLVQAFIPGMCTCQLGIITNMSISKNPSMKHVSVNGYPLDIKVTFTIKELYNALSISPSNDPASFLFNETLNDYMANLAGLQPSVDTYTRQRKSSFKALQQYFQGGEYLDDIGNSALLKIEDSINPFIANGS